MPDDRRLRDKVGGDVVTKRKSIFALAVILELSACETDQRRQKEIGGAVVGDILDGSLE